MALAISGINGVIRWGYYNAAKIEGYAVYRDKDGHWTMTATLVLSDAFKMRQRPLMFVAPYLRETCSACSKAIQVCVCREPQKVSVQGEWRWPIESIEIGAVTGHTKMTAVLGPQVQ